MFGYVRIWKPELKMKEYDQYQGVYCSLCRQMGKRFGHATRMTLSYDFTFLALLRAALSAECVGFHQRRCVYNPFKKCLCCGDKNGGSDATVFAADAAVLLLHYDLIDKAADKGFFKKCGARAMLLLTKRGFRKAQALRPELDAYIADCMERQAALESAGTASLDAAAEPSAQMLARLATDAARSDEERQLLERFGYCLGRWIYLIDAADDLAEDAKRGDYNPYLCRAALDKPDKQQIEKIKADALFTLNACLAECIEAYESMKIERFDEILRNILTMGMPRVMKEVTSNEEEGACESV